MSIISHIIISRGNQLITEKSRCGSTNSIKSTYVNQEKRFTVKIQFSVLILPLVNLSFTP